MFKELKAYVRCGRFCKHPPITRAQSFKNLSRVDLTGSGAFTLLKSYIPVEFKHTIFCSGGGSVDCFPVPLYLFCLCLGGMIF
jgi:hypothetical protein